MNINLVAAVQNTPLKLLQAKVEQSGHIVPAELQQAVKSDPQMNMLAFNTMVEVQQQENKLIDNGQTTRDQSQAIEAAVQQVTQAYQALQLVVPTIDLKA